METRGPLAGGQPWQFEARALLPTSSPPIDASSPPIDEHSALIEALHSFAPDTFEVSFSQQDQSSTRSIEIGSVEVWEQFVATLQAESAIQQNTKTQALYNFITHKLRFWIDLHPQGRRCLLHLKMTGLPHDVFLDIFMKSVNERLKAIPCLFPENSIYLNKLCKNIRNTGSGSWRQLSNKQPDNTLSFGGAIYEFPGLIIEVGDSQTWEGKEGVKNKATKYEDDSKGMVSGVLYLGFGERSIGMIGSKSIFPSYPLVRYLDGTLSTHAVEVIPLTSLTDHAYSECRLLLRFAYFGAGQELFRRLKPKEQEMGFFYTFKEILQMMEVVNKIVPPSTQLGGVVEDQDQDPLDIQEPWDLVTAIQASLFITPPDSLPYYPGKVYKEDTVEDLSLDEDADEKDSSSSDWSTNEERNDTASASLRYSGRLRAQRKV